MSKIDKLKSRHWEKKEILGSLDKFHCSISSVVIQLSTNGTELVMMNFERGTKKHWEFSFFFFLLRPENMQQQSPVPDIIPNQTINFPISRQ